jgi:hypothetical protein
MDQTLSNYFIFNFKIIYFNLKNLNLCFISYHVNQRVIHNFYSINLRWMNITIHLIFKLIVIFLIRFKIFKFTLILCFLLYMLINIKCRLTLYYPFFSFNVRNLNNVLFSVRVCNLQTIFLISLCILSFILYINILYFLLVVTFRFTCQCSLVV